MSIRYLTTGNEFQAKRLLGEGRHQLSVLKNDMAFQGLKQLQRTANFDDGTIINCLSCFGQDVVNVYVPPFAIEAEEKKRVVVQVFYCWCTDYFSMGKIIEKIGVYGDIGDYPNIENYNGIRYRVHVCQGSLLNLPAHTEYVCISSDFAEYAVDDKVIVFMRGVWTLGVLTEPAGRTPLKGCKCNELHLCTACEGTTRPGRVGEEADGSYLIMPLKIDGVN